MNTKLEVTVTKEEILAALWQARKMHEHDYNEAVVAFYAKLDRELKALRSKYSKKQIEAKDLRINLTLPVNCDDRYDKYIDMLEKASEQVFKLDQDQYDCFMRDEWDWAQHAKLSNSVYR